MGHLTLIAGRGSDLHLELYLPSDASFQLQAHTDGESFTNAFHSNNVGKPPQANVTIVTHNGLISINKRF